MKDFTEEEIFGRNVLEFQRIRKMVVGHRLGPAMRWWKRKYFKRLSRFNDGLKHLYIKFGVSVSLPYG